MKMIGGGNKSQGLPATTNMRSGPIRNYVFSQAYRTPRSRPQPTGGVVSSYTDSNGVKWIIHTFNSDGSFTVNGSSLNVQMLVVGGGGGGGAALASGNTFSNENCAAGGGGGGGEVKIFNNKKLTKGTFTVVVGKGGQGGKIVDSYPSSGGGLSDLAWADGGASFPVVFNGSDSKFDEIIAAGGKAGQNGLGRSEYFLSTPSLAVAVGYPSDSKSYGKGGASGGNIGGSGTNESLDQGAGGGGASSKGSGSNGSSFVSSADIGGSGGAGTISSITNVLVEYGRGGGGGLAAKFEEFKADGSRTTVSYVDNAAPGNDDTANKSGKGGSSISGLINPTGTTIDVGINSTYNFSANDGQNPGDGGGGASSNPFRLGNVSGGVSINKGPNSGGDGADGIVIVGYKVEDL